MKGNQKKRRINRSWLSKIKTKTKIRNKNRKKERKRESKQKRKQAKEGKHIFEKLNKNKTNESK